MAHRSKDWDVQEPLVSKEMVPGGNLSTAMDPEGRGSALGEVTGPLSSGGYPDMLVVNRVRANAVSIRVNICVESRPTLAVVDSGAEVTIMNSQEFHQLGKPLTLSPPAVDLVVADQESRLRADGTVEMELVIGNHKFKWPIYVAQIGDDFLLGSDILDAQDIVVSSRRGLQVRGVWVPCKVARRPVHNRRASVVMPHDVDIPPSHETILKVPQSCEQITGCAVLGPLFEDNRELMIGRSLVDLGNEVVPVRVVNLSDMPQRLRKGHLLGELQPVETVAEMAPKVTVWVVGCHPSSNAAIESSSPAAEEEFQEDEELPTEEALQKES